MAVEKISQYWLEKIKSSSYHIEQKTFIEVSYIYNIHTGGKTFAAAIFEGLWVV